MFRCVDRFARPAERAVKIGDDLRLPRRLGDVGPMVLHRVESFEGREGMRHCANVVRLADGARKAVALHWLARYADGL